MDTANANRRRMIAIALPATLGLLVLALPALSRAAAPNLSIPIPDLHFSDYTVVEDGVSRKIDVPWIAQYVAGLFRYGLLAASLMASVMFMVGGFQYLTSGDDSGRAAKGKKRITDAVLGVFLLLFSYTILTFINPDLASLRSLRVITVTTKPYQFEESGDTDAPISGEVFTRTPGDIYCPYSGGPAALPQIVESMRGKVAYRFGGKGGPPPYSENPNKPWFSYNDSCPDGNVCLDCSGFVNYALRCAGMSTPGGGTASIFAGQEQVSAFDAGERTVNGKELRAGDLIGFVSSQSSSGVGHVYLYIGGGLIAESSGGASGRQPGANPVIRPISDQLLGNVKFIRRAP